jgi:RNA polymerase sigma-70 factor (ECF subfamily)
LDRIRAAAVHPAVSLDEVGTEPVDRSTSEEAEWHEPEAILQAFSDQQVIDALRTLPEEIRWALLLVDVEGLEHAEAATILNVPVGTIKSRAHRGRAMLREVLTPLARERRLLRP